MKKSRTDLYTLKGAYVDKETVRVAETKLPKNLTTSLLIQAIYMQIATGDLVASFDETGNVKLKK